MNEQQYYNNVSLSGEIIAELSLSHEVYGEKFYSSSLKVKRLSEVYDVIPILVSERLISEKLEVGSQITVRGQFRSYNKIDDGKSHLLLTLFIRDLRAFDESVNANTIELLGFICKPPIFRVTPFMREICDCLIAVNRAYNKSDYIPCIAWGRNARYVKGLRVGEKIFIEGRIQSREYQKKIGEDIQVKVAYEVSVSKVMAGEKAQSKIREYQQMGIAEYMMQSYPVAEGDVDFNDKYLNEEAQ